MQDDQTVTGLQFILARQLAKLAARARDLTPRERAYAAVLTGELHRAGLQSELLTTAAAEATVPRCDARRDDLDRRAEAMREWNLSHGTGCRSIARGIALRLARAAAE